MNRKIIESCIEESIKFQQLAKEMGYLDLVEKDKDFMRRRIHELKTSNVGRPHAWIGVNPPVDKYNSLKALYEQAVESMPYGAYQLCAEQHTKGGIRPHLHILMEVSSNTRKNHIITRLAKAFELEESSIQVRISKNKVLIDKWRQYLRGEKADSKKDDVKKDAEYRENNNIPHIYSHGSGTPSECPSVSESACS